MRRKSMKRILAFGLSAVMVLGLSACGGSGSAGSGESSGTGSSSSHGLPSITLYPRDANLTSGTVNGYMGDLLAEHGVSVDVWAYSDEKTTAILASGDMPDIMYVPVSDLDTMIQAGLLLNLEDYVDQMPHVKAYEGYETALNYMRAYRSNGTGELYALPLVVGESSTSHELVDPTDRNAVKLNWAAYEAIGAPEIRNFDDLIDVMGQMLENMPTDSNGNTMYGTVLNTGSDDGYWYMMTLWYRFQGYLESELSYLLEQNMVTGEATSILSEDSLYYAGLKWYNKAYQAGLIDPDSFLNDRATQKPKLDNGLVMVPSGYLPGWADTYYPVYIPGTTIYYNSDNPYGDSVHVIGVSAKTENIDACLAFLDMLADPDAYLVSRSGPEGEFWYVDENGDAYFTEEGMAYLSNGMGATGFPTSSGEEVNIWNTPFIVSNGSETSYGDGEGGKRISLISGWSDYNNYISENDTYKRWQATTGHDSWMEWLEDENAFISMSDLSYIASFENEPDDDMQLYVDSIDTKVIDYSWLMIQASTDEEFEKYWNDMLDQVNGLLEDYDVISWRLEQIENAKAIRDSLEE